MCNPNQQQDSDHSNRDYVAPVKRFNQTGSKRDLNKIFDHFLKNDFNSVVNAVARKLPNLSDAPDHVATAIAAAYAYLPRKRSSGQPFIGGGIPGLITRIALRAASREYQRVKLDENDVDMDELSEFVEGLSSIDRYFPDEDDSGEDELDEDSLAAVRVGKLVLASLPPEQQTAILRLQDGLSASEVGEEQGVSGELVRQWKTRWAKKVREKIVKGK